MKDKSAIIDKIVAGYVAACLWYSVDQDDDGNETFFDEFEPSLQLKGEANYICALFYDQNTTDCDLFAEKYRPINEHDVWECLGHDLWLTSQGHGAGFWDRGLGDLGDRLSNNCSISPYTYKDAYLGDDKLVCLG